MRTIGLGSVEAEWSFSQSRNANIAPPDSARPIDLKNEINIPMSTLLYQTTLVTRRC